MIPSILFLPTIICSSFSPLLNTPIFLLNSVPSMVLARKVHASRRSATSLSACPAILRHKFCITTYSLAPSLLVKLSLLALIVCMAQWCKSFSSHISTTQQAGVYLEHEEGRLSLSPASHGIDTRGSVKNGLECKRLLRLNGNLP